VTESAVLLLSCPDRPGIVSRVATFLADRGANILRAEQSESVADSMFHQRIQFNQPGKPLDVEEFRQGFAGVAAGLDAVWEVHDMDVPMRTAILVSKQLHCLLDLLGRWRVGDIPAEITSVVSNHEDAGEIARGFGLDFHHLPVTSDTKADAERELDRILVESDVELVVLARYMQVLSDSFIERWAGKVINIHHSFLPAFPGAKPYHQAMDRGVKLLGATAHYATVDLDEGPIIEQGVTATSHRDSVSDFVRRGREVEARVLAGAVRAHLEHRVIVAGRRTIVFE
jgi:formyltetrahydrofolate deformylase